MKIFPFLRQLFQPLSLLPFLLLLMICLKCNYWSDSQFYTYVHIQNSRHMWIKWRWPYVPLLYLNYHSQSHYLFIEVDAKTLILILTVTFSGAHFLLLLSFSLLFLVFYWMGPICSLPITLGTWWGTVVSLHARITKDA